MHSQQHNRSHCDDMKIDEFDHHFQAGMDALATAKNQQQQQQQQQVVMNKQQQQKSQQHTVDMDQMKKQQPQQHMAKQQHAHHNHHHHHRQQPQHHEQHGAKQQQTQTKQDERVAKTWEHVLESVEQLHDIVDAEEKIEFVKEHLHTDEQQQQQQQHQHDNNVEEEFDGTVVYSIRHGGNREAQQPEYDADEKQEQEQQEQHAPPKEGLLARRSKAKFLRKYSQQELDSIHNQPMVNESTTMVEDIKDYADTILEEHKHKPMQSHAAKSLLSNAVVADLLQQGKLRLPAQLVGSKPSSRLFNRKTRHAINKKSKKMRSLQRPVQMPINYQSPPSPTDAELLGGATEMEHLMHGQPPAPSAAEGLLDHNQIMATVSSMNMDKEPHRFATYQTLQLAGSKRQLAYRKKEHRFAAKNQDVKEEMQVEMEDREGAEQRQMLKQMQKEQHMQKVNMMTQSKKNQQQQEEFQGDEEKHSTHFQQQDATPGEYTPPNISTQIYKDFSMKIAPNIIHPNSKPLAAEFDYSKHDWANGSQQQHPSSSRASEDEDAQWKTVGKDGHTHAPTL